MPTYGQLVLVLGEDKLQAKWGAHSARAEKSGGELHWSLFENDRWKPNRSGFHLGVLRAAEQHPGCMLQVHPSMGIHLVSHGLVSLTSQITHGVNWARLQTAGELLACGITQIEFHAGQQAYDFVQI